MTDEDRQRTGNTQPGDELVVTKRIIGVLWANNVRLERAGAGPVAAGGNVSVHQGGCGPVISGGNVSITQGGCGPVLAKGNVSIRQGGCQTVIAGGDVAIGERGFVGLVLSPKVTIEPGAKVLLGPRQALAAGAAMGIVTGLLIRRSRGR